eukprot:s2524_g4.t1
MVMIMTTAVADMMTSTLHGGLAGGGAMENLTTGAVLKDKLTHIATDLINKVDHTVQNFGKNKPSEDAPITYKEPLTSFNSLVVHRGGALVRSGYETTSAQVHQLSEGEIATVVEQAGRRVRIISPVEGWVSVETKDGVIIMRPTALQRRGYQQEAFESHFESKFERLKAKQRQGANSGGLFEEDPRASDNWRRDRSPDDYEGGGSRRDDRWDDRRDGGRRDDRRDDYRDDRRPERREEKRPEPSRPKAQISTASNEGAFVPRLVDSSGRLED